MRRCIGFHHEDLEPKNHHELKGQGSTSSAAGACFLLFYRFLKQIIANPRNSIAGSRWSSPKWPLRPNQANLGEGRGASSGVGLRGDGWLRWEITWKVSKHLQFFNAFFG